MRADFSDASDTDSVIAAVRDTLLNGCVKRLAKTMSRTKGQVSTEDDEDDDDQF